MIVSFYFRIGPSGGPFELVRVPPRRYPMTDSLPPGADRGDLVPGNLRPCAVEHACNLCDARTLEATSDLPGDDWTDQIRRLARDSQQLVHWWPLCQVVDVDPCDGHWTIAGEELAELSERVGNVELCPSCFARYGDVTEWPDELLDRVYGPEDGPVRCYPEASV